jgi:hypothetical protein
LPHQFIKPLTIKLSSLLSDLPSVSTKHHLPLEPIRSKGQATLQRAGCPDLAVMIRDISAAGIGVFTASLVDPGTAVDIHIHSYAARGEVRDCRPEGEGFYLGIALTA